MADMPRRSGYQMPLLLLGAFRAVIDELHVQLAQRGHEQARPIHGFALQAIGPDGVTIAELGRRLGVTKQAAAKTARALQEVGYAQRVPHPKDGRASILTWTPRGLDMLEASAEILDRLRQGWADQIGEERVRALEDDLSILAGGGPSGPSIQEIPGWLQ